MPGMKQAGLRVYQWFEDRLGLGKPVIDAAEHEVPASTSSWWYVFGSAATVLARSGADSDRGFCWGLSIRLSAGQAWASLEFLDHSVRLGWFLRAMHGWGSDFMIAIVLIHLAQVFLFGALQISARAHVDRRRLSAFADAGNGIHRAGFALRPGRLLGPRHRRFNREAVSPGSAALWSTSCSADLSSPAPR